MFHVGPVSFMRVGLVICCATTRGTFVTSTDSVTSESVEINQVILHGS